MSYPFDEWDDFDDYAYEGRRFEGLTRVIGTLTMVFVLVGLLALAVWVMASGLGGDEKASAPAPTPFPTAEPRGQQFVTIPEGLTNEQLLERLEDQFPTLDPVAIQTAIDTSPAPALLGAPLPNAEGYLFPETYAVDGDMLATEPVSALGVLFDQMRRQFDLVAGETNLAQSESLVGYTPYQVLIIASLIEEEAFSPIDRPKIARVIYNRLDAGWTLGIDATVSYALGGDTELSNEDLQVDSPYNTRKVVGLPPSPIAAPGRASIEAALRPVDGDWMYYVRTDEDGEGTHTFAVTEAEFEAARQLCIQRDLGC